MGTLDPYDPTLYDYVAHLWITICTPPANCEPRGKFLFHLNKYQLQQQLTFILKQQQEHSTTFQTFHSESLPRVPGPIT